MVDIEVETALNRNMVGYIANWKLENTTQVGRSQFLRYIGLGMLALSPLQSQCLPGSPLGRTSAVRRDQKWNSFQVPCAAGALLFSPLLFPIYPDQWPENKDQACIIIINAEKCVKPWGICCFTHLHPPKNLPSQSLAKGLQSALPQINPFGFSIALDKYI